MNRKKTLFLGAIFLSLTFPGIVLVVGYHSGSPSTDFSLTDLEGITFQLSDFKGKIVVIDFMAT